MRACEDSTVDLSRLFEARGEDLRLIAVVIDDAGNVADDIRCVHTECFHPVEIGSNAVRPCLECDECLVHSVDRRCGYVCPLALERLDNLDAREVDGNFDEYLFIHMTEHSFRVTHHAVVVPCRHLNMQRTQTADNCANLTHMCEERNRTFPLHNSGVARHARNGQIFGEFPNLIQICCIE